METYDFFKVWGDKSGIRLFSTSLAEMQQFITEMRGYFPSLRIFNEEKLPSGEPYYCGVDHLNNKDIDVLWWVIKQLCLRGWEPLGVVGSVHGSGSGISTDIHYTFRHRNQ